MSPVITFNHRTKEVNYMALKSKTNKEELPYEIEGVNNNPLPDEFETTQSEQISFDDIDFEAEFVDEEDLETKKFYTISGKESQYEPEWEKYGIQDLDVGAEMEGRVEISKFENDDKTYDALRIRVMDDGEIVDLYVNYPKKHWPYVRGINKGFDFYRKCFDFIYSVLRLNDEHNVVDSKGEEINRFNKINIEMLAKYVDQHERIGVRITEGNADSEYDSFIIYKLE